jgi:hypothetical protein
LQIGILLEDEFILEFIVLSPSESDSSPVEILLEGVAVVFQSVDLSFVEIHVVFGGGLAVDAVVDLLL